MSIYEYDEEKHMRQVFAEGEAKGGLKAQIKAVDSLMEKMNLSVEKACEVIGITMEEYKNSLRK